MKRNAIAVLTAAVLLLPAVSQAEVLVRLQQIPGTYGLADVWKFVCPAGGNFDLTVQNQLAAGGPNPIDFGASVLDSQGTMIDAGDDEVACTNPGCAACPQMLAVPCTAGGTYYIQVYTIGVCGTAPGVSGGYRLILDVRDSQAVSLPAKSVKLGGGPKTPKLPAFYEPRSNPMIDDGRWD